MNSIEEPVICVDKSIIDYEIRNMKTRKTSGQLGITPEILKISSRVEYGLVKYIVNKVIRESVISNDLYTTS